jgi:hypothetical protein
MSFGTRTARKSSPPTSEFGFVPKIRLDCALEAEAKVIESKGRRNLGKYISKFRSHFLGGRYSALCPAGVMIGYYSTIDPAGVFRAVGQKLSPLAKEDRFAKRCHSTSQHKRQLRKKQLSVVFTCHHLLMAFGEQARQGALL